MLLLISVLISELGLLWCPGELFDLGSGLSMNSEEDDGSLRRVGRIPKIRKTKKKEEKTQNMWEKMKFALSGYVVGFCR